ncbi:hypothetical protein TMU3MR103_2231 [Tetragenococcus muriaticus 3MR10-3]|uniref:Uncharacterized protein n=1 Tax=Tetragenococcus muriaticus 3MR10-3 TaxID=1302648 RepID=A0A091BZ42_9ENTE|nr:hypothetical protein TMU3MR103_2231 [Tetragenococcus muriaticus 3MR10-3]
MKKHNGAKKPNLMNYQELVIGLPLFILNMLKLTDKIVQ